MHASSVSVRSSGDVGVLGWQLQDARFIRFENTLWLMFKGVESRYRMISARDRWIRISEKDLDRMLLSSVTHRIGRQHLGGSDLDAAGRILQQGREEPSMILSHFFAKVKTGQSSPVALGGKVRLKHLEDSLLRPPGIKEDVRSFANLLNVVESSVPCKIGRCERVLPCEVMKHAFRKKSDIKGLLHVPVECLAHRQERLSESGFFRKVPCLVGVF